MIEQLTMAINANSQAPLPGPSNETGNYPSNIWCRNCNQYSHSNQVCQAPRNPMPMVPPQGCFQQNPPLDPNYQPPRGISCSTCHRMHPISLDMCWVESGVTCSNCSRNHLTDRCRQPNQGYSQGNSYNNQPPQGHANFFYYRPMQVSQPNHLFNPLHNQSYNCDNNQNQGPSRDDQNLNFSDSQNQTRGQAQLNVSPPPIPQDA